MITTLTALLGSKYGKYLLEVGLVSALVFGAYRYAEHRGAQAQKEADAQKQEQQIEATRKTASDLQAKAVDHANEDATAADARAQMAEQQFVNLVGLLQRLADKRQAGTDQVAKLPDSEVHPDIVAKLGLRPSGDQTPGYLPKEERAIDNAVTQYPLLQNQVDNLFKQVQQSQDDVEAQKDKVKAKQEVIDAQEAYRRTLEAGFKQLFDLHPPKYRSPKCLFIWKCGTRKTSIQSK